MSEDDIEASKAPLIEHLIELRSRLVRALVAVAIAFVIALSSPAISSISCSSPTSAPSPMSATSS